VQQIPIAAGAKEGRVQMPQAWAGLIEADLQKITGVADAVFCHPGRFICGARSLAGAQELAARALKSMLSLGG